MTVQEAVKFIRDEEEITLYDTNINAWRTGVVTKEYIPPAYLAWEVVAIQTDLDGRGAPVLELSIKPNEE